MSGAAHGSGDFVWEIVGYDGSTTILEQRIPLNDADDMKISSLLKRLASQHLNDAEISAGLADVHKDDLHGNRITLHAGQNPHYVASLWRDDELAKAE